MNQSSSSFIRAYTCTHLINWRQSLDSLNLLNVKRQERLRRTVLDLPPLFIAYQHEVPQIRSRGSKESSDGTRVEIRHFSYNTDVIRTQSNRTEGSYLPASEPSAVLLLLTTGPTNLLESTDHSCTEVEPVPRAHSNPFFSLLVERHSEPTSMVSTCNGAAEGLYLFEPFAGCRCWPSGFRLDRWHHWKPPDVKWVK